MMQKVASAKKDSYNNANRGRIYCENDCTLQFWEVFGEYLTPVLQTLK